MKNTITLIICLMAIFLMPVSALADERSDLKESVQAVREKLVVLLVTTDKNKQTAHIEDIKQLSQDINIKLKTLLEDKKTSEDVKKKLTEFQLVWITFRTTRDTEIIPRILSGDEDKIKEAKTITRTIQAERFQKMQVLLQ